MVATVGWPEVAVALIAAVPGIIAAIFAGLARKEVKAQDGTTLSRMAAQTHAVVTRTLGERKTDGPKPPDIPDAHKREADD